MTDAHTHPVVWHPVAAGGFTGPGTDAAQNPWHDIGPPVQFIGPAVAFFIDTPYISGNIGFGGTGLLAGNAFRHLTEIPGIGGIGDLLY